MDSDRMDGDYIEVDGPRSLADVVAALAVLLPDPAAQRERMIGCEGYPLVRLDQRLDLYIDFEHDGPRTARLAIAELDHDHARRRQMADRVYRLLAGTTDWRLRWTADDARQMIAGRS